MANQVRDQNGDWGSWALIVFLFAIGIWPVALFLLYTKLFGNDSKSRRVTPMPPLAAASTAKLAAASQTAAKLAARPSRAKAAAKSAMKPPKIKKSNARMLEIVGVLMVAMGVGAGVDVAGALFSGYDAVLLWELLQHLAVAVGGIGMFCGGLRMETNMRRYARYLAVMGDAEAISFAELGGKLGWSRKRTEKDLQKMIDRGYFGGKAYLNSAMGYFFRSAQADEALRGRQAEEGRAAQPPKEAEEGYSGILRNIRRANDRIADPVLTLKIDRLEKVTARIFKAVEEDPKKRGRIDTFLNYYLPTTQKLLDAYAEFDSAGVEGENLRQAKSRIVTTMDSIVAGFEHQLDELYQSDVMDVDSDIRVMESMLHRDTASVERDFGLGAVPTAPTASAGGGTRDVDFGGTAAQTQED